MSFHYLKHNKKFKDSPFVTGLPSLSTRKLAVLLKRESFPLTVPSSPIRKLYGMSELKITPCTIPGTPIITIRCITVRNKSKSRSICIIWFQTNHENRFIIICWFLCFLFLFKHTNNFLFPLYIFIFTLV